MSTLHKTLDELEAPVLLHIGDTLEIEVLENPSSGFVWIIEDSGDIEVVRDEHISAGRGIGAGGKRRIAIRAAELGEGTVRGRYQRPHDQSPRDEFVANIVVRP